MSIGGISGSLFPPAFAPSAKKNNSLSVGTAPPNDDSTDPKDIIAEIASGGSAGLLKYQEAQIAKKAKEDTLKSLGLKDADLQNLDPQQLKSVDDAIAKAIKAALKNALQSNGKDQTVAGTAPNPTTQATANTDPARIAQSQATPAQDDRAAVVSHRKSLIDGSTLASLFDFQSSDGAVTA